MIVIKLTNMSLEIASYNIICIKMLNHIKQKLHHGKYHSPELSLRVYLNISQSSRLIGQYLNIQI